MVAMKIKQLVMIPAFALLISCGGESDVSKTPEPHVWQDQVDALEKAKDVENMILDSAAQQRQAIENQ